MRLWRDSERTVKVRWFRCEAGAKDVELTTPFVSRNWEYTAPRTKLGEVRKGGVWNTGVNPVGYPGETYCGTDEDWLLGGQVHSGRNFHTDDKGYSECCGQAAPTGRFGTGVGLSSSWRGVTGQAVNMLLSADISTSTPGETWEQAAAGGLLTGGAAAQLRQFDQAAAGGLLTGGAAEQDRAAVASGDGGLLTGGAAAQQALDRRPMRGGVLAGGSAGGALRQGLVMRGGVLAGGSAGQKNNALDPAYGTHSLFSSSVSGSLTMATPGGAAAGDLLVWWIQAQYPGTPSRVDPAGWQLSAYGTRGGNRYHLAYTRTAVAGEPGSHTISLPGATFCRAYMGRVLRPRATNNTYPLAVGANSVATFPSKPAQGYGSLALQWCCREASAAYPAPTGYTLRASFGEAGYFITVSSASVHDQAAVPAAVYAAVATDWVAHAVLAVGPDTPGGP